MSKPEVHLVTTHDGDQLVYLNRQRVIGVDASEIKKFELFDITEAATKIAGALGVEVIDKRFEAADVPAEFVEKQDWSFNEVDQWVKLADLPRRDIWKPGDTIRICGAHWSSRPSWIYAKAGLFVYRGFGEGNYYSKDGRVLTSAPSRASVLAHEEGVEYIYQDGARSEPVPGVEKAPEPATI